MRRVGLFEAKQKLSDLVEQAERGERIGITRRGKLTAVIGPAGGATNLQEVFDGIEAIRRRAPKEKSPTGKQMTSEGAQCTAVGVDGLGSLGGCGGAPLPPVRRKG